MRSPSLPPRRWLIVHDGPRGRLRVGTAGTEAAARRWLDRLVPRCPGRWSVVPPAGKPAE